MSKVLTYTITETKQLLMKDNQSAIDRLDAYYGKDSINRYKLRIVEVKECKCERCGSNSFMEYRWPGCESKWCCLPCNTR